MKAKLTKTLVESIEPDPSKDVIVYDTEQKGFHLKVTPKGRRIYLVVYRNAGHKQRRPKIGEHGNITLVKARQIAASILGEVAEGKDPSGERIRARESLTIQELWLRYRRDNEAHWKPRTKEGYDHLWKKKLSVYFGRFPVQSLHRSDIDDFMARNKSTPGVANRSFALLRSMLNYAIAHDVISKSPAHGVKTYKEKGREAFLSPRQLAAILEAITIEEGIGQKSPALPRSGESKGQGGRGKREVGSRGITTHQAAFIRLLILTGARSSDIKDCQWNWVDFESSVIRYPDSKTGKKVVHLSEAAKEELERLRNARSQHLWVIEGKDPSKPLNNPQKAWRRVKSRAKRLLEEEKMADEAATVEDLRLHDLRHSFASFAVAAGVPLYTVAKALGHSQLSTSQRYAHLADDPVRETAEIIGTLVSSSHSQVTRSTKHDETKAKAKEKRKPSKDL